MTHPKVCVLYNLLPQPNALGVFVMTTHHYGLFHEVFDSNIITQQDDSVNLQNVTSQKKIIIFKNKHPTTEDRGLTSNALQKAVN